MAVTQIDVVNYGLVLAGEKTITSMTANVKGARLASAFFEMVLRECLSIPHVDWTFATTRTSLSELDDTPASGYDHQYNYPPKCHRIISMVNEDDDTIEFKWRREVYLKGAKEYDVLLTNEDTVRVKYIVYRNDPEKWPGWFTILVGTKIGLLLCEPLKQDKRKVEQLMLMAEGALNEALAGNGSENAEVNINNERMDEGNTDVVGAATSGYLGNDWSNWGQRRVL